MKERNQQRQRPPRVNHTPIVVLLLVPLLLLPALAIVRLAQSFEPRIIAGYLGLVSVSTFGLYWHDKRQAQNGGWRTPESTLHLVELCGGWPAAYLAQRAFRHKISKLSYQVVFWAIVVLHQYVALDFLQNWRFSRSALLFLQR